WSLGFWAKDSKLCARGESRLDGFVVTNNFWTAGRRFHAHSGGNLRLTDKRRALFDDQARRFQIALERAFRFQFATFAHRDVALNFSEHGNRFGFDFATDVGVFTDGEHAFGVDFSFHLAVDQQLFLELDRAFDFDVAREHVFA